MRWATKTGQFITAPTKAEAEALAKQYGWVLAHQAPAPAKKPRTRRPIGVWDDLTQSWVASPTIDYAAIKAAYDPYEPYGELVAVNKNGTISPLTRGEMAALRRA